jgi:hypothetical protein
METTTPLSRHNCRKIQGELLGGVGFGKGVSLAVRVNGSSLRLTLAMGSERESPDKRSNGDLNRYHKRMFSPSTISLEGHEGLHIFQRHVL